MDALDPRAQELISRQQADPVGRSSNMHLYAFTDKEGKTPYHIHRINPASGSATAANS